MNIFGRAYRLPFRLLGIPVLLDVSFLIILPLLAWVIGRNVPTYVRAFDLAVDPYSLSEGYTPYVLGLLAALGLFVSVVLHELGHAVAARAYGVRVRSITLWFLGGVAAFDEFPKRRGGEAVVAIAGPIVSIAIAVACWGTLGLLPEAADAGRFVFHYLMAMNIVLVAFNMLPALPLDGGRVLRSLLALRLSHLRATQVAVSISKVLAILLGLWGLLGPGDLLGKFTIIAAALFIYSAANAESQQSLVNDMLRDIGVRDLMARNVATVSPDMPVSELISRMIQEHHLGFPVVDASGQVLGMVGLRNVQDHPPSTPVQQIMNPRVLTIPESASALDAFNLMGRNNFGRVIVTGPDDRMVGILTKTDLMRAIRIRATSLGARGLETPEESALPTR